MAWYCLNDFDNLMLYACFIADPLRRQTTDFCSFWLNPDVRCLGWFLRAESLRRGATVAMDGLLLYMENEHFSLVDALPYIDTQLGAAEVAQQVKALIEEEMTQFEPRDYLASLPAPELPFLSSSNMQEEFSRVSMRQPLGAIDQKKYEVERPEGEAAEDEESWKSVTAKSQMNLEYTRIKSLNLELLEQWGKKAWIAHNILIRGAEKVLGKEATELRASREEVNKKRKLDQVSCGNDLRKLMRELEQYQQDNSQVEQAVRGLESDLKRLRDFARERGVDTADVDPKPHESSEMDTNAWAIALWHWLSD